MILYINLIEQGANIDYIDEVTGYLFTIYLCLSKMKNYKIIQYFIAHGIDINQK